MNGNIPKIGSKVRIRQSGYIGFTHVNCDRELLKTSEYIEFEWVNSEDNNRKERFNTHNYCPNNKPIDPSGCSGWVGDFFDKLGHVLCQS